jgi:DNA gyrase/topoisomerase IV subunit A
MSMRDGDSLTFAGTCSDDDAIVVACSGGKVATFLASAVREMARTAAGVRAKRLGKGTPRSMLVSIFVLGIVRLLFLEPKVLIFDLR